MGQLLVGIICALFFLLVVAVRRVYYCVPAKELKRLARVGDPVGMKLYKAVAYDGSLAILLWIFMAVFLAASVFFLAHGMPTLSSIPAIMALIWLGFGWLALSAPHDLTVRLTVFVSPLVSWLLSHLDGMLRPISHFTRSRQRVLDHTGLYERQDFLELLNKQKQQPDSRLAQSELALLERVLRLSDQTALDIVTHHSKVRVVKAGETIGPKLMDELHKSGLLTFPVVEKAGERVVGVVSLEDLIQAKQGGTVASVTKPSVAFVRDDFTLTQVMQAFRYTSQRLLIVINAFEEFAGVIAVEALLEHMFGAEQETDNFVAYEDRSAVAHYQAPQPQVFDQLQPEASETNETPTPEAPEVVE